MLGQRALFGRRAHRAYRFEIRQARRHQRVGPRRLVRLQALDRVVQIGPPTQEIFRPPGQRERERQCLFDEEATERPNKTHAPKRISSRRVGNSAIRAMMNSRPCSVARRGS
jgi:hypothetical protein